MTLIQAILLGIIQGLTEFLPISSSAHLVLTPYLLGWELEPNATFIFDVLVQLGTLVAVIAYFWRDLYEIARDFLICLWERKPFRLPKARLGWYLIVATIPAVIAGLLIKEQVEQAFDSPTATAMFLLVTALFLFVAERYGRQTKPLKTISWMDSLVIGIFQAVSLFPGVSRSGATISGGMLRNLDRPSAARFSFLMSVPAMLGAGLLATLDLFDMPNFAAQVPSLLAGFLAALVIGYLSIRWLLGYLTRHSLNVFAVYCVVLSAVVLLVALLRG
jgi:undecaprenyl-diphosphatase